MLYTTGEAGFNRKAGETPAFLLKHNGAKRSSYIAAQFLLGDPPPAVALVML